MAKLRGGKNFEKAIKVLLQRARPGVLKVGFLKGTTYLDGTSLPLVAASNEFGVAARGQPPRPFFRNAIRKNRKTWGKTSAKLFKKFEFDTERVLNQMGEEIAGDIKEEIQALREPKLKASTIKRKGFSKPLIDSSDMYDNVDHIVTIK